MEGFGADVEGVQVGDESAGGILGGVVVDGDRTVEAGEGEGGGATDAAGAAGYEGEVGFEVCQEGHSGLTSAVVLKGD